MRRALTLVLALTALSSPAAALELRSDLPLWGTGAGRERVWPEHFTSGDSFGCASGLRFGDWRWMETDDGQARERDWLRISNYGVFHCAYMFQAAYKRVGLPHAIHDYGYFVELGRTAGAEGAEDLFALQVGLEAGSRYYLLAAPVQADRYERRRYRLLEPDCPKRAKRRGPRAEIFGTGYCAVNDRRTMIVMARNGAKKKSETWLEWVGPFDPPIDD